MFTIKCIIKLFYLLVCAVLSNPTIRLVLSLAVATYVLCGVLTLLGVANLMLIMCFTINSLAKITTYCLSEV